MTITLWEDKQSGLTNSEMDSNFTELANGCIAQSVIDNRPLVKPTLNLDFTKGILDSRITFTRNSTATYFGSDGLLKTAGINQPRFEYDPITRQPKGLLIEESRTNLLTYSEQFDNAIWAKIGTTIVANNTIAPDGSLTADTITFSSGGYIYQTIYPTFSAGTAYTFSIYTKNSVRALTWGGATPAGTDVWSVTSVGNGWYRQSLTRTFTNAGTGAIVQALMNDVYQGTGSFVYWGAQLEQGAFPTSYIPTTSAQVTRSYDNAFIASTGFSHRSDEGTLYAEAFTPLGQAAGSNNSTIVTIGNPNAYLARIAYNASLNPRFAAMNNSFAVINVFASATSATVIKYAGAYSMSQTSIALSVNGGTVVTSNTILPLAIVTPLVQIGFFGTTPDGIWNSCIKKIAYYPKRLTDIQLQEITK